MLDVREHFFRVDGRPYLACLITWSREPLRRDPSPPSERKRGREANDNGRKRDDPTEGLDEAERKLFLAFREWRDRRARKEAISHVLILTNRQPDQPAA